MTDHTISEINSMLDRIEAEVPRATAPPVHRLGQSLATHKEELNRWKTTQAIAKKIHAAIRAERKRLWV